MIRQEGYLIRVLGDDAFEKADLMGATHRLIETDYETEDGLPVWEMRDLDGFLVTHQIIPEEFLEGNDDE